MKNKQQASLIVECEAHVHTNVKSVFFADQVFH